MLPGLVLLAASCGSSTDSNNNQNAPPHDVSIVKGGETKGANAFSPANFTISLATTNQVTWYNSDIVGTGPYGGTSGVTHRIISDDNTTFHGAEIPPGGIFKATLSTTGTFPYHCEIHPSMTGTLTVDP
jgi:plastocyanin